MTLAAHLVVDRPAFRLDVALDVAPGQVLALLGPNGAGKSTSLRALAGLVRLTDGSLVVADRVLDRPADDVFVPPSERSVGMVFQDHLLFPHLTVRDNVAFGLRARGVRAREARGAADGWLDRVGLADRAGSRPAELSGGQAQRVALARALAPEPSLLLLDEPLSALDAGTRMHVRTDLRAHLSGFAGCTVLVTHDPLDALVLADVLVVVEDGLVVQQGSPVEVARAPRTDYVASLVGLNLYRGTSHGGRVEVTGGGALTSTDLHDGPVFAAFPPGAVVLHAQEPAGSARNTWPGVVAGLEQRGDAVRVQLDGTPPVLADVTAASVAELRLAPGTPVWAAVKATEVRTYPAV